MTEYKRKTFRFFQLALIFFVASVFLNPINPKFQFIQADQAESCEINFESETKSDTNNEAKELFSVWISRNPKLGFYSSKQSINTGAFVYTLHSIPLYLPIPPPLT